MIRSHTSLFPRSIEGLPQAETHSDEEKAKNASIHFVQYNDKIFNEWKVDRFESLFDNLPSDMINWIHIDGPPSPELLKLLAQKLQLHPLLMEDLMTEQRPKLEPYDPFVFIVLRNLHFDLSLERIANEQVSILLGNNFVLSFQEQERTFRLQVTERIRGQRIRPAASGADYLVYTLIDVVVDNYFLIIEKIAEKVDQIEYQLLLNPTPSSLQHVNFLKREVMMMRKSIWPLREVISRMQRSDYPQISSGIALYLRDLYDHTIQVIDTIETFRDMLSGILDLYISNITQKTNEIMKTLTIFAVIFAPLTFMTGIWGMNFDDMPDLHWKYGYPFAISLMFVILLTMTLYFKRKRWL